MRYLEGRADRDGRSDHRRAFLKGVPVGDLSVGSATQQFVARPAIGADVAVGSRPATPGAEDCDE
jgi:hypothetical protein